MGVSCYLLFIFVFTAFYILSDADAGRWELFKDTNILCSFGQFMCGTKNTCIPRHKVCDGKNDCGNNFDEENCSNRECPDQYPSFFCGGDYAYGKCIPLSWKCDGVEDCSSGKDEKECNEGHEGLSPDSLQKARYRALKWIHELREEDQPSKWGSDVSRIAVALYLSSGSDFTANRTLRDELSYELSLDLLSKLALKQIEDVSSTELASYMNAFLVTCIDPRKFYVLDLVRELRKRVDTQNYTSPAVVLALCNAGERITKRDLGKLLNVFWKAHREFWTDTQALAVLALSCAAKQPYEVLDMDEINELTLVLKRRQYKNGTVENLKTTALVLQALFASEREADKSNFDESKALEQILRSQKKNGSFGNIPITYYVLPVLGYRSLVNISTSHCKSPVVDETEALKGLMNQVGEKWRVRFSLWIGNNRTVERTLSLSVPANSSFYSIMEFAAGVDNRFKFQYSVRSGKPYIYSISEILDDPENEMFWFLFKAPSSHKDNLEQLAKSPSDIVPSNEEHFIFWYKCGSWNH